ncbi:hypothetical protein [Candidatus Mycobacterium methanotrophicum]|uniref:Uncharacterized protein n=1 Tax=Candidatus Mycobacterium methanotrophicum TaxID=2943498 RepID=A0ABY4QHC4_9MYCO|nr:hypothetical protein [Candidatus Mycobacterium methanotrophicum]UQX09887.1 hypothetical protein M5I08_16710 [Candidatus Mycobacterium methanotrophicum]
MDPLAGRNFAVRLRAQGAKDLRVVIDEGQAGLELVADDSTEPDAEARTLIMWGRRPEKCGNFRSYMPAPMLARMQILLSGY